MPKPDIKSIIQMGIGIGGLFAPGAAKPILDIVSKGIADTSDPQNVESLKNLADSIDQLIVVAKNQEARIRALEGK